MTYFPPSVCERYNENAMAEMWLRDMAAKLQVSAKSLHFRLLRLKYITDDRQGYFS